MVDHAPNETRMHAFTPKHSYRREYLSLHLHRINTYLNVFFSYFTDTKIPYKKYVERELKGGPNGNLTVTLKPMEIKTFVISFNANGYH